MSGFRTVEAGLRAHGPWPARELLRFTPAGSPRRRPGPAAPADGPVRPGAARARRPRAGPPRRLVPRPRPRAGRRSAVAEELATLAVVADVSPYDGLRGPVLQARPDRRRRPGLQRRRAERRTSSGSRCSRTTWSPTCCAWTASCAWTRRWSPDRRGELLEHGTPEEVELRACAVQAVELLVAAHGGDDGAPTSTTCSGTAAAAPATRRTPAIGPGRRRTEPVRSCGRHGPPPDGPRLRAAGTLPPGDTGCPCAERIRAHMPSRSQRSGRE